MRDRKKPSPSKARRSTDVESLTLSSLRRRPSQRRGAQRVTDVLDAFEHLLARKRCEEITMDDLSRTADIQIGSLYHFFPDMTAVILTALERALADEGAAFEGEPGDDRLDFDGYLNVLERRMAAVWQSHGRLLGVLFAYQRHPLIWKITRQQREYTARLTGQRLQKLFPRLASDRAIELGRMLSVLMAVLLDNLEYLPQDEGRNLRRETRLILRRYIEAEGQSAAPRARSRPVTRTSRARRS